MSRESEKTDAVVRNRPEVRSKAARARPGTSAPVVPPGSEASKGSQSAYARARGSAAKPVLRAGAEGADGTGFEAVQVRFDTRVCKDLTSASKKEWLLANGLGGYAMSTVAGLNTRRYHGLLVAAMRPPVGRAVVLSKMEETVMTHEEPEPIDTNFYPGIVHPRGFEHLEGFRLYPLPAMVFAGSGWRLEKMIHLVHGENTVVVTYKLLPKKESNETKTSSTKPQDDAGSGDAVAKEVRLRVRPLFAFRDAHQLSTKNERIQRTVGVRAFESRGSIVRCTPYPEWEPVYLVCREAQFFESVDWFKNVEYPQERYRGLDHREDLWSYGYYETELNIGDEISIACTLHAPETRAPTWPVEREVQRRLQILDRAVDDKPFANRLALAAEQFLVRRERDLAAVAAAYPWFTDRARDTMIALPGLLLVAGRFREAKAILRVYARALDRGMLPNRLPDGSDRPEYRTVDATLWFFVAIFKYLQYTEDFDFVKTELRIPMLEIVRYYEEGTRYGIRVDGDGLLQCGEPGMALTWMDARTGDQALTPRTGKPVEVNALWYNALKIMERLAERFSIPSDMARFGKMAERLEDSFFGAFWNEASGCLYDVVGSPDKDASIRPNQILAVSLPFPLLDSESAQSVVRVVGEKLLTPVGLRTLDPGHADYRGVYDGDAKQRDSALHQGTVWSWLLGPYITALVKARGDEGRTEALKLLEPFEQHLQEDGLGQISEIFWGNLPHWPRGCPASACSVAEMIRAYYEDILDCNPGSKPSR